MSPKRADLQSNWPTYTLAEAQRELGKRECAKYGHDYEILQRTGHDGPDGIICIRCGRSWQGGKENP